MGVVELVEQLGQAVDVLGEQRELEAGHRLGHDLPAAGALQHQLPQVVGDRGAVEQVEPRRRRRGPRRGASASLSKILAARTAEYWR